MSKAAQAGPLKEGSVIAQTYELKRVIGRGGMGTVWEGSHLRLPGKRVAIKILHASVADDPEALARFRREAEIACRLGHPNIVEVHDFNKLEGEAPEGGSPYLILELLSGQSLDQRLRQGPLDVASTIPIVRQIASALHCAHEQGVVHRDLKPQNVFLVPSPTGDGPDIVKVLDFGISKIRGSQTVKTQENTLLGTPQYMAPEQATGDHDKVDGRTDLFAFAAMIYEILSGRPAFGGQSIPEVVYKVVHAEPTPLSELVPGLTKTQAAAIHKALSKKQDDRFPGVAEFVETFTGAPMLTHRSSSNASNALAGAATIDSSKLDLAQAHTVDSQRIEAGSAATVASQKLAADVAVQAGHTLETGIAETIDSSKLDRVQASVKLHGASDASVQSVHIATLADDDTADPGTHAAAGGQARTRRVAISFVVVCTVAAGLFLVVRPGQDARNAQTVSEIAPARESAEGAADTTVAVTETKVPATVPAEVVVGATEAGTEDATDVGKKADSSESSTSTTETRIAGKPPGDEEHASKSPVTKATDATKTRHTATPEPAVADKDESNADDTLASLSPEARDLLLKARNQLRQGHFRQALELANRADREQNNVQSWFIKGQVYCHSQDQGMVNAAMRNLPKRLQRRLVRYCNKNGFQQ